MAQRHGQGIRTTVDKGVLDSEVREQYQTPADELKKALEWLICHSREAGRRAAFWLLVAVAVASATDKPIHVEPPPKTPMATYADVYAATTQLASQIIVRYQSGDPNIKLMPVPGAADLWLNRWITQHTVTGNDVMGVYDISLLAEPDANGQPDISAIDGLSVALQDPDGGNYFLLQIDANADESMTISAGVLDAAGHWDLSTGTVFAHGQPSAEVAAVNSTISLSELQHLVTDAEIVLQWAEAGRTPGVVPGAPTDGIIG